MCFFIILTLGILCMLPVALHLEESIIELMIVRTDSVKLRSISYNKICIYQSKLDYSFIIHTVLTHFPGWLTVNPAENIKYKINDAIRFMPTSIGNKYSYHSGVLPHHDLERYKDIPVRSKSCKQGKAND